MSSPQEFWRDEGGNAYHTRNRVEWWKRKAVWDGLINATAARSVFELGCGPGWNLTAIKAVHAEVMTYGADLNGHAIQEASRAGHELVPFAEPTYHGFDLTFTVGCLIHVPPETLEDTMKKLINMSNRYVLAIEYFAEQETPITYRGQEGLLWKRNYGGLYQDLGLAPVVGGEVGPPDGFDFCRWDLLQRTI